MCSNLCLVNNYCKVIIQNSRTTQRFAASLEYTDKTELKPTFSAHSKVFISKISVKYFPLAHNKYNIIKKKSQPFKTSRKRYFTLHNSKHDKELYS